MTELEEKQLVRFGKELENRKWFKEMDHLEILVLRDKRWESKKGFYDFESKTAYIGGASDNLKAIKKTILHEVAHHIEYRHAEDFIREKGRMHGVNFKLILERIEEDISLKDVLKGLVKYRGRRGWKWNSDKTKFVRIG